MKFNHVLIGALLTLSSFCYSSPELLAVRKELKQFITLSEHCHESSRATSSKASFEAFKKIKLFYLNHRVAFKKVDTLDLAASKKLARECAQVLKSTLAVRTKMDVKQMEEMALADSMQLFTRAMPNLLHPTAMPMFLRRLILLTLIEVGFYITNYQMFRADKDAARQAAKEEAKAERIAASQGQTAGSQPAAVDTRPLRQKIKDFCEGLRPKNPPVPIVDRLKAPYSKRSQFSGTEFAQLIGLSVAKSVATAAVDEFSPKGISSYIHRFSEVVLPKVMAVIVLAMFAGKHTLNWGAALKIINPIILGKAFLHPSHVLYKPLKIISYILPFVSATAFQFRWDSKTDALNGVANMAMDGLAGFFIFNAVPGAVEKALPRRNMQLNPYHRRKAIAKTIREVLDTSFKQWNKLAGV